MLDPCLLISKYTDKSGYTHVTSRRPDTDVTEGKITHAVLDKNKLGRVVQHWDEDEESGSEIVPGSLYTVNDKRFKGRWMEKGLESGYEGAMRGCGATDRETSVLRFGTNEVRLYDRDEAPSTVGR